MIVHGTTRFALLLSFLLAALFLVVDDARGGEVSEWAVRASNSIGADPKILARLTGQGPAESVRGQTVSIVWPQALLETPGRPPVRLRVELELTLGLTMAVGGHTQYPGLITKLDDARGKVVNLDTNRAFTLRLSERGSWMGKFIHSDSHGRDHLAVELPFSLFDEQSGLLIAQNKLLARFDLSNPSEPYIPVLRVSPTQFDDLRQGTVDIASAIAAPNLRPSSSAARLETYRAQARASTFLGHPGKNQSAELFQMESLALYGCDTNELMQLEFQSSGFTQGVGTRGPGFTLRLRYAPDLIEPDHKVTFFYPVAGQLVLHQGEADRVLEIGPGNHGKVASSAYLRDKVLTLDFGIALREGSELPAVARAVITCSADGSRCGELTLSTAVDQDGRIMSPRSLSTLLEYQRQPAVSERRN